MFRRPKSKKTTLRIHQSRFNSIYSYSFSFQTQNAPFPQILPTRLTYRTTFTDSELFNGFFCFSFIFVILLVRYVRVVD